VARSYERETNQGPIREKRLGRSHGDPRLGGGRAGRGRLLIPGAHDAVVVGAGPNGLAAAITLAGAGRSVLVLEAEDTIGGGCRSAQLTLPGFIHDICSTIHPLASASPFFRSLPLAKHGLEWIHPIAPLAHPLDDGSAVFLLRSVEETANGLGNDGGAYRKLMRPLVDKGDQLVKELLGRYRFPGHPLALARFGRHGIRSSRSLARSQFRGEPARALLAGMAAHSIQPLNRPLTAAVGLALGLFGHVAGWPVARAGSQRIVEALASHLRSLGGEIAVGTRINSLEEVPGAPVILLDVTPRQLTSIAKTRLSARYRRKLKRFRHGPGVFKIDWALDAPIPWKAEECAQAATVHVGGLLEEIEGSEAAVWRGIHAQRPFVILAQQSLFDSSRTPESKHTAWAYCHVPNGSSMDMTERIEAQVERFAPGFRDVVLARSVMSPADLERHNPNYIGGDISGGVQDLRQVFARPTLRPVPYSTPAKGIYLCSSSTPPGAGVHGMCGHFAALAAMR
jgi:phytoene dehydrogenase-like protein